MKPTLYQTKLLATTVWLLFLPLPMSAQLSDVIINVVINDLGNARVEEIHDVIIPERATEGFLTMNNLQGSDVGELAVSDESGKPFTAVQPWRTNLSREEKAFKCGINNTSKGKELCWGVGTPGRHLHNIHYTITRLVKSYEDFDGFLFTFYEASHPYARHLKMVISKENGSFSPEDTRVWAFNFYGTIFVKDGKIVVETTRPFSIEGEKINVMVEFDKGLFRPATQVLTTFYKSVKREAFKGSDYTDLEKEKGAQQSSFFGYGVEDSSTFDTIHDLLLFVLLIALPVAVIIFFIAIYGTIGYTNEMKRLFSNGRGKMMDWYRDIPFDGDIQKTAKVLCTVDSKLCSKDIVRNAYILRMLYNKQLHIIIEHNEKGEMEEVFQVEIPLGREIEDDYNHNYPLFLQTFLYGAAGADHKLQPKELDTYAKNKTIELRPLARKMVNSLRPLDGKLEALTKEEVTQVFGFRKYLEEFTLTAERDLKETGLWKEFMVYAYLYGIADKVGNELGKVFPDVAQLGSIESTLAAIEHISGYAGMSINYLDTYETPEERQIWKEHMHKYYSSSSSSSSSNSSRSSGRGGRSSYDGGGGSRGGGGTGYR